MDSITISKIGSLFALIGLTFLFGALPYVLVWRSSRSLVPSRRKEKVIKYFNCFGGGVFFGALLLHLMTEGSEQFEDYKAEVGYDSEYPFFNLFVAGGFFIVALIEYVIHSYLIGQSETEHSHPHIGYENLNHENSLLTAETNNIGITGVSGPQYGAIEPHPTTAKKPTDDANTNLIDSSHCNMHSDQSLSVDNHTEKSHTSPVPGTCTVSYSHVSNTSPIRAFLLLIALSFHTIFDGLAIGLQVSTFHLWEMFTAIAVHKCIMAFCLGLELFAKYASQPRRAACWIGVFSLMSPIGIIIGIFVTSGNVSTVARHLSSGILQGVAAGTFMYVTFLEILSVAWQSSHDRRSFLEIFFAMVGFACMAGVKGLEKD